MFELIGKIVSIPVLILTIYQLYKKIIYPRMQKTKLHRFYQLVKEWFDEIDKNLDNLNLNLIYSLENKVDDYIKDNNLEMFKFNLNKKFMARYLKFVGLKPELCSDKVQFAKYSRFESGILYLSTFWGIVRGNFYRFYSNYKDSSKETNFGDVEMPIKMLKMYLKIKTV